MDIFVNSPKINSMNSVKRIFLLSTIVFFTLISCSEKENSQKECNYVKDYYPLIYKADNVFDSEDYNQAYQLYKKAFAHCKPLMTPDYDEMQKYAQAAAYAGDFKAAYEMAKGLILGGTELNYFENWPRFNEFMNSKYGDQVYANYSDWNNEFKNKTNFDLRADILQLIAEDQRFFENPTAENIRKTDSVLDAHEKQLKGIFESYGYPNSELIGPYSWDKKETDIVNVLLKTRDEERLNYFIPKVREFVETGKANPRVLANLIDHYRLNHGEEQKYGTFIDRDGSYLRMPYDLKEVDSARVSIGLPTLKSERLKDSLNK